MSKVQPLVDEMVNLYRDKKIIGENRGEIGRSLLVTIGRMARSQ